MSVLQNATNRLADVLAAEHTLMSDLNKVRGHKAKLIEFIDMYRRFDAPEEPQSPQPTEQAAEYAEVTPAAAERVTPAEETPSSTAAGEVGNDASSAPSKANAGVEAMVREEVQPAPMAEAEPVSRLAAGRTADAEEAGPGPVAPSTPVPPTPAAPAPPEPAGETQSPVSPAITKREQVRLLHEEHPDWTTVQISEHLGLSKGSVSGHASALGISLARSSDPEAEKAVVTLTDQVRFLHRRHPALTASLIAMELGAKETSVSTILASIRRKEGAKAPPPPTPVKPEFASKRDMLQHYGDVAARLGKAK